MASRAEERTYQATRLYLIPPVFDEHDERQDTGDYGLMHLAITITKCRCFAAIIHFLLPSEAARVLQARKIFGSAVEAAEEQIVRHLHKLYFSRVPLPLPVAAVGGGGGGGGGSTWTRYLHDLITNKSHKVLLMGGFKLTNGSTNQVDMMVIDDEGTITWEKCAPMIKKRSSHSAYYCQGQVLAVSSYAGGGFNGPGTTEFYDVLSQLSVQLEHALPIPNLCDFAMAELNGKAFVIGGSYYDNTTHQHIRSDRVFYLNMDEKQADGWIEQNARPIKHRNYGPPVAAATYQGKLWLAGAGDLRRSIKVFDPDVGSWQTAGNLTRERTGSIALFVINDDLFAAGEASNVMWIEKRDGQTGAWQLVSELDDRNRKGCSLVACGSTIYFLGGNSGTNKSWNSFDMRKNIWASQQEQYRNKATRQLPRSFTHCQAVCITPTEQLLGLSTWTSYPDFVHHQDADDW